MTTIQATDAGHSPAEQPTPGDDDPICSGCRQPARLRLSRRRAGADRPLLVGGHCQVCRDVEARIDFLMSDY